MVRDFGWLKIGQFVGVGMLVGLHWICFYGSIKLANASVALITMATTSFFTAILEPYIRKVSFRWFDLATGIIIIPAMGLIVAQLDGSMYLGIAVGFLSAILASSFAIFNKMLIGDHDILRVTFIELGSAFLLTSFFLVGSLGNMSWLPVGMDWMYMIVLVLLCTTMAYVLSLRSLKHLSAFNATLIINLEPVYGIILAILILDEHKELNLMFYTGVAIILCTVLLYPIFKKKFAV